MLRALAASKPGGRVLELGTGTGLSAAWLLAGMDAAATLDTIDVDPAVAAVARRHLGRDPRVQFHVGDAIEFLRARAAERFDLVFADAMPGKFVGLDAALAVLAPGGVYVIDDLLPQPNWPDGHAPKVPALLRELAKRPDLALWPLQWDTGIAVAVRR
jgi:predicted O-methyltransferase YrrM